MKITECEGNGQGVCSRCGCINWMTLLYKIENVPGNYCTTCIRKMKSLLEVEEMDFTKTVSSINSHVDKLLELYYKMGYCNGLLKNMDSEKDIEFIRSYQKKLTDQAIIILNKEFGREVE